MASEPRQRRRQGLQAGLSLPPALCTSATNMLALDRAGKTILETTIQVMGPPGGDLVVVYRGVDRESYSCTPECAPRITLGDNTKFFGDTMTQAGSRNSQAQAPVK